MNRQTPDIHLLAFHSDHDPFRMTAADDNTRFIEAARTQGMLTEQLADQLLNDVDDADVAATMVLRQGLMDARQVDMIQTLVSGTQAIPGYTIIDIIGHGGMGVVFRARQEALERDVALKTILVGGRIEEAIQRFRNEATSVAKLNHPNIVTAFDSGQHAGRIYFSMELVDGQNLTDYVLHRRRLCVEEALGITRQAALGLAHAWEHHIVHRDIKPDNLLMTSPSEFDQSRTVKITDLGLAHLNTEEDAARITQTGAAVGSPLYMSPEQLRSEDVDCRSDIYSLGSTLYFMLAGQVPFEGKSVSEVLYNKASGKAIPLSSVVDLDDRVERLVTWMMATESQDRPQDYRMIVQEIDSILGRSSATIAAPDLAATQSVSPAAGPADPSLQDTLAVAADTTPGKSTQTPPLRPGRPLLVILLASVLVAGIYLATRPRPAPPVAPRLQMEQTWQEALFDGQSLDGWDDLTPGTPWQVKEDPVEGAFALTVDAKPDQTPSARRRIEQLPHADTPWFEVEVNVLLGSAPAAGMRFGATSSHTGYRVRVSEQLIELLDEDGSTLGRVQPAESPVSDPLHLRVTLQPTGWLVEADEMGVGNAAIRPDLLPEIRLFAEGGQAYFTGITAAGLEPPPDAAQSTTP